MVAVKVFELVGPVMGGTVAAGQPDDVGPVACLRDTEPGTQGFVIGDRCNLVEARHSPPLCLPSRDGRTVKV